MERWDRWESTTEKSLNVDKMLTNFRVTLFKEVFKLILSDETFLGDESSKDYQKLTASSMLGLHVRVSQSKSFMQEIQTELGRPPQPDHSQMPALRITEESHDVTISCESSRQSGVTLIHKQTGKVRWIAVRRVPISSSFYVSER